MKFSNTSATITFLAISLISISSFGSTNTLIEIQNNKDNCLKVDATTNSVSEDVGRQFKTAAKSINFVRSIWYGSIGCNLILDSPKGPLECRVKNIFTDNGGKTAFASVYAWNCS
jgi:hypothetical protein